MHMRGQRERAAERLPDEKLGQTRGPADMLSTLGRSPRGKGVPVLSCTNLG